MMSAPERVALASFLAGAVLAGGNAVGVRFSNRELAPLWGAGLRFAMAAALLLALMAAMRLPMPRGRVLGGVLTFGALNFGAGFALIYFAFVELHAGFGQILLALVPLATLLLAVLEGQERWRPGALAGSLLALAGVAVMAGAPLREGASPLSIAAGVGGALCFAQAAILIRRLPRIHPVTVNAVGMAVGAVLLVAGSLVAGEPMALPERGETWAAMAYLVVIGSGVVFLLYLVVLRYWAASRAAYAFVLTPFVTVGVSAWLDAEPVGWELVAGGLLVLAGVWVGALRPMGARTEGEGAGAG